MSEPSPLTLFASSWPPLLQRLSLPFSGNALAGLGAASVPELPLYKLWWLHIDVPWSASPPPPRTYSSTAPLSYRNSSCQCAAGLYAVYIPASPSGMSSVGRRPGARAAAVACRWL
ncbi:hypothetical protein SEVIR_7G268775v4 [Setaria viridis]